VPHSFRTPPSPPIAAEGVRPPAIDYVTGLAPRGLLEERLATLVPAREPVAMLIVDVVGLKAVNERQGFLAGDGILRAAALRLRDSARGASLLARLGGDELVAIFLGPDAAETAQRTAAELAAATAPPALRSAALAAARGETAAQFVERLYATLRRR
jgi:diguanylate cyclase (GGDEF)-like protein